MKKLSSDIEYIKSFYSESEADEIFKQLLKLTYKQESLKIFGKQVLVPRKILWIADKGVNYSYSNTLHEPEPWPTFLKKIKNHLNESLKADFNGVLINSYSSGQDSMGWHSDDEKELGSEPLIASLSFGATRRFLLKNKKTAQTTKLLLEHGSLLLMRGKSQEDYKHSLPKMLRVTKRRINLTFRKIY